MAEGEALVLYHFEACSFCNVVRSAAESLGVELELRDIRQNQDYARELAEAMGRMTVPVLRIPGSEGDVEWLPESADIIEYLKQRVR
ncbi:MAG: glutathione S-transferase N-terminal domain-containing protein [Myxococcota bacterium]|jgi:glutaredoxin|nr:glutathione S-transferase N-terminal domain-containing protein [Myxococcota bacterium]